MSQQHMKKPCKDCPMRKDSMEGWLGSDRMAGILKEESFVCHKTINGKDRDRKQCAGHMLLMGRDNAFVRAAERLRVDLKLSGRNLVFDSADKCIAHHGWGK